MNIYISCGHCLKERISLEFYPVEVNDEGVYELTCKSGHKTTSFLQNAHFEILFELGAKAFLDGYTREAISSFAASLERFYEFCIRAIVEQKEIDIKAFDDTWKYVASQSERQLGAFYFCYLSFFNEVPEKIPQKWIELRNNVIHKGHIPTLKKTEEYAEYLYGYMMKILTRVKKGCGQNVFKVLTKKQKLSNTEEMNRNAFTIPTAIDVSVRLPEFNKDDFKQAMEKVKNNKWIQAVSKS
ncbi:hypothetical protein [Aneurinibacillus aneurinilyticus]|uniref:Uncharacterized protein n=1 Tax=Aneurinibacillus aneurinilyticus ATCC 12856 TaxID=649747 RepID=U1X5K1_ANEAE|nr:hypothetical protein [Aneurinibacillus aneurinilyticus]ERI10245.1 hypothetical protein HMPREF0083_01689 [Aneurinibacillus aneurinilyticus ATCC 12856]MED0705872.1 hypothetical protein [Aneurinibacillus aneurinilyticus]MED0722739.1 hypothetical protein [Aneurinibacillus aneurinilyticus]MED0731427.1 hypothetical protein [Aneurinibacillus aneurinilyticus]MED0740183.1 hypothetical protein [Aneurinibacillus aneurinilyticus]